MKSPLLWIIGCLLYGGVNCQVPPEFECFITNDRCDDGIYPDPTDCFHFFHCTSDGGSGCLRYRQRCREPLKFDWNNNVCATPETAVCYLNFFTGTFIGLRGEVLGAADPFPFNVTRTNLGQHWNEVNQKFQTPATSIYYISISAGALPHRQLDLVVSKDNDPEIRIMRGSTAHSGMDTTSRDFILNINQGQDIHVANRGGNAGAGGMMEHLETSLSIFDLRDVMNAPLIAFAVGRDQPLVGQSAPFPFNEFPVNEGGWYDELTNIFRARADGIFFFHISVGAVAGQTLDFIIERNTIPFIDVFRNSTTHNETDTLGRSILVQLNAGDTMYVANGENQFTWSSGLLETSFSGFEYDPEVANELAWSVARTTSWSDPSNNQTLSPVDFGTVLVNEGNVWNPETNIVSINTAGYYYVHFSTGALPGYMVHFYLMQSGQSGHPMAITRMTAYHNGVDTLSRSGVFFFPSSTQLWVESDRGTGIFSNDLYQTSFMGFLLYTA